MKCPHCDEEMEHEENFENDPGYDVCLICGYKYDHRRGGNNYAAGKRLPTKDPQ